ncbi:DUF1330 domain-containing protein [Histidinibacterium lentulum]|uniref:DUF1330 domain-containing protein n=1 Tax=Histidinibacterium lentulum TaxID=2480588 RepID=A0A3N2QYP8_9RHOB|nr:DUF1330 domain-containing protein [Histidinibacterium lentulum]ROU00335.1 DUF1330 domain-containing protein [Histidinibacterium lentulum]
MAKAYWMVHLSVTDSEAYRPYVEAAPSALAEFGGRYLVRAGQSETPEGEMPHSRHVLIEFPSYEAALAAYRSDAYQAVVGIRHANSTGTLTIVEGV